jgi:mannitol/fructose-specific phosphotransferase system IIA component (Ntr-type)
MQALMKISDILTDTLVATGLVGDSKKEIIDAMIDLVASSPKVTDKEKVRKAIFEREEIMSTGVGNGFAIPHGKTDAVTDIVAAFAVTAEPIDYQSLDEKPVRLVFLLVGKDNLVGPRTRIPAADLFARRSARAAAGDAAYPANHEVLLQFPVRA